MARTPDYSEVPAGRFRLVLRWLAAVLLALASPSALGEQLVTLETREGVIQRFSLLEPAQGAPFAAAVLFPGNAGVVKIRRAGGKIRFSSHNFLVRARSEFARHGIAAAVVDAPSDRRAGMSDRFRAGPAHLADIRAVVRDLKRRYGPIPVYLVGASRGTVSAAHLAAELTDDIAGVVLTSAVFRPSPNGSPGLSGFDFARVSVPLLLVHHRQDGCRVAPYRSARQLSDRYPLVTVAGGAPVWPGRCSALSEHGFHGSEAATVEAIVNWMENEPYPAEID